MCTSIIYFLCMGFFGFYPCNGQLRTILSNEKVIHSENQVKQFVQLLKQIHVTFQYDYIVFVNHGAKKSSCIFEDSIIHIEYRPIMILYNLIDQNILQLQQSSNFILFTCSCEYLIGFSVLNTIYQYVPHVIWFQSHREADLNGEMEKLCFNIHRNGYFRNVIITPESLDLEGNYFNCNLQKHIKSTGHEIFVNSILDIQGISIVTECDQLPPRSILFYDDFGQLKLTGFVANYLTTFAERYNATLVVVAPAKVGETVHAIFLANKTFQGLLDVAAALVPYEIDTLSKPYSYPAELMEFCYMIPLPHIRPTFNVYFDIIEVKAIIIILAYVIIFAIFLNIGQGSNPMKHLNMSDIVLNDKSIRGLLGQSFVMPRKTSLFTKYILFLLFYASILLCTSYQAYLQSHLIHPSLEKRMETYDDIRRNNFKIMMDDQDSSYLYLETLDRQQDLFKENTIQEFLKLRDSMDVRYIYPVSQNRWSVFHERQKLFQRKLFYYSSQLCLSNMVLLSFPLRPGLPYKYQFNQHLLDIRDTGLLNCWLERNFLNMVRFKLSSFKDLSVADEYGPQLELNDLLWIWILYAVCILLSLVVFIGELY